MQWGTLLLAASLGGFGVGTANAERLQSLGVPFVANGGEVDSRVALYARMPSGTVFVGKDGVLTYLLTDQDRRSWALKERFVKAKTLRPSGREPSTTHVSRFSASGDAGNAVSMAAYQWADIGEVWSGIAVDVKASGANAEKFFHLAPNASVSDIKIAIDGAEHLKVNTQGELAVATGLGEAVFSQPVAWQELDGERRAVRVKYALRGDHQYGFTLGAYDHRRELIIDPLLQSTYIGGTGGEDHVAAIAINSTTGDVYVTGTTSSTSGFPVSAGALQPTAHSSQDAFIALLPANLKSFTQVTFYGGSFDDEGQAILIHPNGDIYVAGYTASHDLSGMAGGAFATNTANFGSAYVIRLDPTLTTLRQGTYYGNSIQGQLSTLELLKLAADATGAVYLAGAAVSTTLPGTAGGAIPTVVNGRPGFIAKFSGDLKTLIQATYVTGGVSFLGLSAQNSIGDIVIEPTSGDVLIAGTTDSLSMPVTANAFQKTVDPDMVENNGFVARLPNTLKSFIALSYVATHSSTPQSFHGTAVVSMALHPANGDVYVYGGTDGDLLDGSAGGYVPTTSFNSPAEFMMRVAPDLSAIHNATFLGLSGSGPAPFSIRIPASGDVYTAGFQCSDTTGGLQPGDGGQGELCISRWSANLSSLVQATHIGSGSQDDLVSNGTSSTGAAFGIGITNDVYLAGGTISNNYPGTSGGAQATFAAGASASGYIARISADLQGVPQPGTLQFSAATYTVADNAGPAHILVNRSNGSSGTITVTVTTTDGTGKAGVDYTASSQVLTFADGDIAPKLFSVPVLVDAAKAGNKTVNLTLSAATGGAAIGTQSTALLTITPSTVAVPGSLQFSAATFSVADSAGNASITVTRSGGSSGAVTVSFATSDGSGKSGTNYTATTQTVTFADGDAAAKTIGVPVKVNGTVGNSFTVNLTLTAPTGGAALGTPAVAVLTINATTAVVVPPPQPVTNTVTVTGKGGGGAIGAWQVLVLGTLLLAQFLRSRRCKTRLAGLTALAWAAALTGAVGIAPRAKADSPQVYAGFGIGQARSVATASDLERKLDGLGFPGTGVSLDDHKLAGKIYGGVSLNQYLSFEAAYVELNKVRTASTTATNDASAFIAAVTAIHPYSARGGSLSALASLPLAGGLSLFVRGGGFVWHGEIDADIPNIDAAETKKTGISAVAGAGMDFAFTHRFALRAEWERYFISRDSMDLLTLGARLKF